MFKVSSIRLPSQDRPRKVSMITPPSFGSVDTIYSADSIEFSPDRNDIFVCGTYQIEKLESSSSERPIQVRDEEEQKTVDEDPETVDDQYASGPATRRLGRALVYQVSSDERSFQEIQRFDGPAILDMKWSASVAGPSRLAISNAEGQISIHSWRDSQLGVDQTIQVDESSTLCLSLDWSRQPSPSIITSLSTGYIAHLVPSSTGEFVEDQRWKAHDYEPWITAWDLWNEHIVWSGGDDCKLKRWDVREPFMPSLVNKSFEGGVTTIASNPHVEHMVAVGSYDAHLRIFDARNARTPLRKIPVGGGIWRTKWHPSAERSGDVLLACMHGGFKVVRVNGAVLQRESKEDVSDDQTAGDGWEITHEFQEHGSIAYGADWSRLVDGKGESAVATCSFYDHLLHLWHA